MNYDSLLELVRNRRSVRRFRPDPVPKETVEKILEAARYAPSAGNAQPWEFVVLKIQRQRKVYQRILFRYIEKRKGETRRSISRWQFNPIYSLRQS